MTRILLLSYRVRFAVMVNRLINFLSRIPLIRNVIHAGLYKAYKFKSVFSVIAVIFSVIKRIITRTFYAGFMTLFGLFLYQVAEKGGYQAFFAEYYSGEFSFAAMSAAQAVYYILTGWFIFSFVGSCTGASIITSKGHDNDKAMIIQLRTDAAVYAKARAILAVVSDVLLYLPFVTAAFWIADMPLWYVLPMMLMYAAFRFIGETLNLLTFRYIKRHFGSFPLSLFLYIIIGAALYLPVRFGVIDWAGVLANPIVSVLSVLTGAAAWIYISRYRLFGNIVRDIIGRTEELMNKGKERRERGVASAGAVDTSKWHKGVDSTPVKSDAFASKTGFAYLNAIFFSRHSRFYRNKLLFRCAIILAPLLLTIVLIVYGLISGDELVLARGREIPFNLAPAFFFVTYAASMGRVVTAAVFSNCDIHMLHYTYYRTKETTLASFKSRFSVILGYNVIISSVTSVSMLGTVWLLFGYMDYQNAAIFTALMFLLGLFFAFNDLFLYYVIQPYDSVGKSNSMAYKVINGVIYFAAFINLQLRLDPVGYTIFIAVMTALYLGVGALLLRTLAPRKFKLR